MFFSVPSILLGALSLNSVITSSSALFLQYPLASEPKLATLTTFHPSGKGSIHLFHGTGRKAAAEDIKAHGFDLAVRSLDIGDFHNIEHDPTKQAVYLTDSIYSAAQHACFPDSVKEKNQVKDKVVYVLEFIWDGQSSDAVYEFPSKSDEWYDFVEYNMGISGDKPNNYGAIMSNLMITGPMDLGGTDKNMSPEFWQYAAIAPKNGGKFVVPTQLKVADVDIYQIKCGNVPWKEELDGALYVKGQYGHAGFQEAADKLKP